MFSFSFYLRSFFYRIVFCLIISFIFPLILLFVVDLIRFMNNSFVLLREATRLPFLEMNTPNEMEPVALLIDFSLEISKDYVNTNMIQKPPLPQKPWQHRITD